MGLNNQYNNEARMGLIMFYTQAPGIMGGSMSKALEQVEEIFQKIYRKPTASRFTVVCMDSLPVGKFVSKR